MEVERDLNLVELISSGVDFLDIVISKEEVMNMDLKPSLSILNQLITSKSTAKYFRERVNINFNGYNLVSDELWEIPEVRNFVLQLDSAFPYWLYFLSKDRGGLHCIIKCHLLPFIRPDAENEVNGKRLKDYLLQRGFPAMNQVCQFTDISMDENKKMTERLFAYIGY